MHNSLINSKEWCRLWDILWETVTQPLSHIQYGNNSPTRQWHKILKRGNHQPSGPTTCKHGIVASCFLATLVLPKTLPHTILLEILRWRVLLKILRPFVPNFVSQRSLANNLFFKNIFYQNNFDRRSCQFREPVTLIRAIFDVYYPSPPTFEKFEINYLIILCQCFKFCTLQMAL